MKDNPIDHSNFVIQLQGEGFKVNPIVAGKVASFWVVDKDRKIRSIFAFATSMTDAFEGGGESEKKILESAISIIKEYIDSKKIEDREEYTFRYKNHQFTPDDNANWWSRSLKILLKPNESK